MGVRLWSSMVRGGSGCCMQSRDGVVGADLRGQLVCLGENCQKFVKWGETIDLWMVSSQDKRS